MLGYPQHLLSSTFSTATFGNGLIAILVGMVANGLVELYGYPAPFLAGIIPFSIAAIIISTTWTENYGVKVNGNVNG